MVLRLTLFAMLSSLVLSGCTASSAPAVATSPARTVGSTSPGAPVPSGSPGRSKYLVAIASANSVSIIGTDGATLATATASPPAFRPNPYMPWTSTGSSRLYYLDGSQIRYVDKDGAKGSVASITVGANDEVGFAVSEGQNRIAVAILTYNVQPGGGSPTYAGMRLFTMNLYGSDVYGSDVSDLFSSKTVAEYPIGWYEGVIVAVSTPICCQSEPINPYAASVYHVADPRTGDRRASLCDGTLGPAGPAEMFGTICIGNGVAPTCVDWEARSCPVPTAVPSPFPNLVAVSPYGQLVAVGGDPIRIMSRGPDDLLPDSGRVLGWTDNDHLVYKSFGGAGLSIFDLKTRAASKFPGATAYLGTVPNVQGMLCCML